MISLEIMLIGILALIALAVIIFHKDDSVFILVAIVGIISIGFAAGIYWNILFILFAFPLGAVLAWVCRDELVSGRKWIARISVISLIAFVVLLSVHRKAEALSSLFVTLLAIISLYKSYDMRWTRKKASPENLKKTKKTRT